MKLDQIRFIILIFIVFTFGRTYAQEKTDSLYSNILKEKRDIQVFLPANYQAGTRYDVLYVLDGEMLSRFVTPISSFAEENELIPQIIIIGIKNNYWYNINQDSRDRDLLPQKVDGSPLSGGADNFILFLKNELKPYVDSHYSTSGKNILFGHSYAGLFTMYAFLTQPELFDSYIASDPALWWNEGYVNKLAEKNLENFTKSKKTLFIGGRSGGIYEAFGIKTIDSILNKKALSNLLWKSISYPDEHHGSVRLKNIYDGLKFTYFGYSSFMLDFFPMDGILLEDKPIPILLYSTFLEYNPGIRYTTDGTEPLPTSLRYGYGTLISAPAVFTLKQFSNFGNDKIARGHFTLGKALPSVQKPMRISSGGFDYTYYESQSNQTSSNILNPLQQGFMDKNFNLNDFVYKEPFSCIVDGYFEAEVEGYYTFFLESDYMARLYIGDKLLINIDRSLESIGSKSFVVPLEKGFYPIRMEYIHKSGNRNFSLTYIMPAAQIDEHLAHLPINIPLRLQYGKVNE